MAERIKKNEDVFFPGMSLDDIRRFAHKIYKEKCVNNSIEEVAEVVRIISFYIDYPVYYFSFERIVDNIKNYQPKKKNKNKK